MKFINISFIVLIFIFTMQSCVEEVNSNEPIDEVIQPSQQIIVASLYGVVKDTLGKPMPNVKVHVKNGFFPNKEVTTDENGNFQFLDKQFKGYLAQLEVKVPGCWDIRKSILLSKNDLVRVEIRCQPKPQIPIQFNSQADYEYKHSPYFRIQFKGNSFRSMTGEVYNGKVNIQCRTFSQDQPNFKEVEMGLNWGVDSESKFIGANPFQSMDVELLDDQGNPLQLASSSPAVVQMKVSDQVAKNKDRIGVLHFNEDIDIWDEMRIFDIKDNVLTFEVTHFSNWSLCQLLDFGVSIRGNIHNEATNLPVQSTYYVILDYEVADIYTTVIANGEYYFPIVLHGLEYDLVILDECEKEIYRKAMPAATSATKNDDILIDETNSEYSNLSIKVEDCAGEPIIDGFAWLDFDDKQFKKREILPVKNGELNYGFLNCNDGFNGTLTFLDGKHAKTSATLSFNLENGDIAMGTVQLCDTMKSFMEIIIDGTSIYKRHVLLAGAITGMDTTQLIGSQDEFVFNVQGPWANLGKYDIKMASFDSNDGKFEYRIPFLSTLGKGGIDITEFEPNETNNPFFRPKKLVGAFNGKMEMYNKETEEFIKEVDLTGSFEYH